MLSMLDNKIQELISLRVHQELEAICKLNNIKYEELDRNVRDSMLMAFQAGVGFTDKLMEEREERNV